MKEFVRTLTIGMAVMLALPLGYRIWVYFHPIRETETPHLTEMLQESCDSRRGELLMTPTNGWTIADTEFAPDVFVWLVAHGKTIFPWEWTDEAKRKDIVGHGLLWREMLEEEAVKLKKVMSRLPANEQEDVKPIVMELDKLCAIVGHDDRTEPLPKAVEKTARCELLRAIRVNYDRRELLKRQWPKWVPTKVRKWIGG